MTTEIAPVEPGHVERTRIRTGTHRDVPAISRLIARACLARNVPHMDEQDLAAIAEQGQLIVLQLEPDEVAAAACVVSGRGLVFLVIDPAVASPQLEHRMIGVADALCESANTIAPAVRHWRR